MSKEMYLRKDKNEFFPTEQWLTEKLYSLLPKDLKVETILDPCCGTCGLTLKDSPYKYTYYDIVDYGIPGQYVCDFLTKEYNGERFDLVVVNPPFAKLKEFVEKSWLYSDNILLIAPLITTTKLFNKYIKNAYLDWHISFGCFKVLVSIGCFHLQKNKKFQFSYNTVLSMNKKPTSETLEHITVYTDKHTQNKPFIVVKLTKARVLRGETLMNDNEVYEANDNSVFFAEKANVNISKGDKIKRHIIYVDSVNEGLQFVKAMNKHQNVIRNYAYMHGGCVLSMKAILNPLLITFKYNNI